MIDADYARAMARYNNWQNSGLYAAADGLSEAERQHDRGAFFGSIHKTLSHLLWGDRIWMSRFDGTPPPRSPDIPASVEESAEWADLKQERLQCDRLICDWAARLGPDDLAGDLTWFSGAAGREISKPLWLLVVHLFNHQTHHRGQVHAMLTAAGAKPGDTDLPFLPEDWPQKP